MGGEVSKCNPGATWEVCLWEPHVKVEAEQRRDLTLLGLPLCPHPIIVWIGSVVHSRKGDAAAVAMQPLFTSLSPFAAGLLAPTIHRSLLRENSAIQGIAGV